MDAKELLELAKDIPADDLEIILRGMPDDLDNDQAGDCLEHLMTEDLDEWDEFWDRVEGSIDFREACEIFADLTLDTDKRELFSHFVNEGLGNCVSTFDEAYLGEHRTFEDFAEQLAEDTGMISDKMPSTYFDAEAFASDLRHDYTTIDYGLGVAVFRNI